MKRLIASAAATLTALLSVPATAHAAPVPTTFSAVSLPFFWPKARLREVTADGAGGVWIGGHQGQVCLPWFDICRTLNEGNPVVRRWVGSSWQEYPLNGWAGQGWIEEITSWSGETWIHGLEPAYAGDHGAYLARFDGSAFQKVDKPTSFDPPINALSTGPAGTWISLGIVGGPDVPFLYKHTGSTWTGTLLPGEIRAVYDLQARTANDVWAVGGRGHGSGLPEAAHFDGSSWTRVTPPELPSVSTDWFVRVAPVAANDVWALTNKYLTHWDGNAWTVIPIPASMYKAVDLAIDASGVPWVTGEYAVGSGPGLYRYSNGTWQAPTLPTATRVDHITAIPGTSTIWGVGAKGDNSDPAAVRN